MIRLALLLFLVAMPVGRTASAQTSPMLNAMRMRDWGAARLLAGSPLGLKVVDFVRMLIPDQAGAAEISAFMQANPDWPDRAALEARYDDALAHLADEPQAASLCATHPPAAAPALLRCAEAYALTGQQAKADDTARTAWIGGLAQPDEEDSFLARWGKSVTEADQEARFAHLIGNAGAALRQLARLDEGQRRLGEARLALRRLDPAALSFVAAVPASLHDDPALLLDQARYLRRTHDDAAAAALWRDKLEAAEQAGSASRRIAAWAERDALARDLMASGDAADAYAIARDPGLPAQQALDADFLAGWIKLRGLHDAAGARQHFLAILSTAHSAISLSRGQYWLGRATADPAAAQAAYRAAAAWPLTYYGQKAALAAGETEAALHARIAALHDPTLPAGAAAATQSSALFQAAQLLVGWQDGRRAADFFLRLMEPPASQAARVTMAETALADGLPDVAVMAARLIGKDGGALPVSGWPRPVQPPDGPAPPALLLGIMRQESGFDTKIVSPAGAHGLMQMMPGTAAELAQAHHIAAGPLSDPVLNMRLGSAYLNAQLTRFGGTVPFAVAAYNAGPHRVQQWLAQNTPPAGDADAMIDWIESIPFAETRNYVQRVLENTQIYAAQLGN